SWLVAVLFRCYAGLRVLVRLHFDRLDPPCVSVLRRSPRSALFPYTTLFRSKRLEFLLRQSEVLLADRPEPPPRDALELWAFGGRALSTFGAVLVARMASLSLSRICSM